MFQNKIAVVVSAVVAVVAVILVFGHLGSNSSNNTSNIPTGDTDPSLLSPLPSDAAQPTPVQMTVVVDFYGFLDNSPPSNQIDYPVIHEEGAGGTGTYEDPITFSSEPGAFRVGTRIYHPGLQKYFIMEDSCEECTQDWTGKGPDGGPLLRRVDLWIGGDANSGQALTNCEDKLAKGQIALMVNPASGMPVNTVPLFNATTKTCLAS